MALKLTTYKHEEYPCFSQASHRSRGAGGFVELADEGGNAIDIVNSDVASPAELKRRAAKKLRTLASRLEREATGPHKNRARKP